MPTSRGSLVPLLIVGAIALGSAAQDTVEYIKDREADNIAAQAILTGDLYMVTAENTKPTIFLDSQSGITLYDTNGNVELGSGDLVFNSTRNTEPCLVDGSESFHCSDRVTMASPTGNENQYIAAAVNPFSSGTGIVLGHATLVLCDGTPNALVADIGIGTSATASGTVLASDNDRAIASGTTMSFTGTYVVPKDQYFMIISASGSDVTRQASDCDLIPYWVEVGS